MGNLNKRDLTIESLKGFAIICVVFIHSTFNENDNFLNLMIDVFSKFAVPLFIFISGYFVYKQKDLILNNYKAYILKTFKKVAIPYIIISLLITFFTFHSYFDFIKNLIFGTASVPYYFIVVIFQLYIMSFFILKLYEKNSRVLYKIGFYSILFYSILWSAISKRSYIHSLFYVAFSKLPNILYFRNRYGS